MPDGPGTAEFRVNKPFLAIFLFVIMLVFNKKGEARPKLLQALAVTDRTSPLPLHLRCVIGTGTSHYYSLL